MLGQLAIEMLAMIPYQRLISSHLSNSNLTCLVIATVGQPRLEILGPLAQRFVPTNGSFRLHYPIPYLQTNLLLPRQLLVSSHVDPHDPYLVS